MITTDIDELKALCTEWQQRLRLQDWDVFLSIERFHRLDDAENMGEAHVILNHHSAKIKLVHPDDYGDDAWRPYDMEAVLVHELLHIHFKPFGINLSDTAQSTHEEVVINTLARALVALKRLKE